MTALLPGTDPIAAFAARFDEARLHGDRADVVALATAGASGEPSVRFVNYKGLRGGALTFYTNYESRKGCQLAVNPQAALAFHWPSLRTQVTIEGACAPMSAEDSDAYFATREREVQLTTWASRQSSTIDSFDAFERSIVVLRERFGDAPIPRPPYWGGMAVTPSRIEFRQSGEHRRHRRWLYRRAAGAWTMELLQP